jgi:hypothetical protein
VKSLQEVLDVQGLVKADGASLVISVYSHAEAPFEVRAGSQGEPFTYPGKHALPCLFVVVADYAVIDPGGDDDDVTLIFVEDVEQTRVGGGPSESKGHES